MKAKTPAIIDLFLFVLIALMCIGLGSAALLLHEWRTNSYGPPFLWIMSLGAVFGVVLTYAFDAIISRRLYGLYLGLVPLLVTFGLSLRLLSTLFAQAPNGELIWLQVYIRMATLGFVIALATFILKLGFSRTVAAYFRT